MKYRWHCGNCGNDRTVTDTLNTVVPTEFVEHVTKDDHYCMKKDGFYVTMVDPETGW